MAFLTNLGVSNGGYPAIRLETATITKNGVYTAPRGVAYSQVNVNVPSSGGDIPYVEVLPAVDEYNEGDVVYLTRAYSKLEPATLYAYAVEGKIEYASQARIIYDRTEGHTHLSNLLFANYDYGMRPFRELFNTDLNNITFTYNGSMHFTVSDTKNFSNTVDYIRSSYYDIVNCSMMQVFTNVDDDSDHIYVNDNEGLEFESRVFAQNDNGLGFFLVKDAVTSISRTDESHIAITTTGVSDPIIYELDTEHQFTAGREVNYVEGYYMLDDGNWVLQVPNYNLTVQVQVSSDGTININPSFIGLIFHNICDKGEYMVYSDYTGWQVYTENLGYLETIYYSNISYNNWNSETEIGIGIVVPSGFNAETEGYGRYKLMSFTPIDYELHFDT